MNVVSCPACSTCPAPRVLGSMCMDACSCGRLQRRWKSLVWEFREGGRPDGDGRGLVMKLLPKGEFAWSLKGATGVATFVGIGSDPELMARSLAESIVAREVLLS